MDLEGENSSKEILLGINKNTSLIINNHIFNFIN